MVCSRLISIRIFVMLASFSLGLGGIPGGVAQESTAPQYALLPVDATALDAWQAMRFGMFIHWGPVSQSGKEIGWSRASETNAEKTHWREYDQFYKTFNPTQFDAKEWVSIAKKAGMRYIVFTSKHHDGFCMWDTQYTDYNIMNSPFQRDMLKELTDECKRQGLRFGPYHSICDWYQPDYGFSHAAEPGYTLDRAPDFDTYYAYLKNQLKELQANYGPFHVFWFDGEWEKPWTHQYGVALHNYCRTLQPDALINNRVDKGRNGMEGTSLAGHFAGDYETPEQRVGAFNRETPWETCMTICRQWAWKPDDELKSLKECLQTLLYTVGGDGNLLFNVGPMPDGRIEPRQVERLMEMGAWMEKHGPRVYGTRGGPYKPGPWGASTCKDNYINLFLMNWTDNQITLPHPGQPIETIHLLSAGDVQFTITDDKITFSVEAGKQDPIVTVAVIEMEGPALAVESIDVP